jgi:hypothetical protein
MTSLSFDEDTLRDILRPLIKRLIDEEWTRRFGRIGPAVVPVPDDEPTPDSSDNDDELPSLALTEELVPSSIPSIPSFLKAVEDAFDSSCVADDALQSDVLAVSQARPTPSSYCAPCTCLLCAPCAPIHMDTVLESFVSSDFGAVLRRFRDTS